MFYNYDNAMDYVKANHMQEIILVEGIFDVWSYYELGIENTMAILGSSLSKQQGDLLLKSGLDWTLSFDNDDAGKKCTAKIYSDYRYKTNLKTIELKDNCDPGDMLPMELMKAYLNRK